MAVLPFSVKQHGVAPVLPFAFQNPDGSALDLTGHTVAITLRKTGTSSNMALDGTLHVNTPPSLGTGYYAWGTHDRDTPGRYLVEWLLDGVPWLPTVGYGQVVVASALS